MEQLLYAQEGKYYEPLLALTYLSKVMNQSFYPNSSKEAQKTAKKLAESELKRSKSSIPEKIRTRSLAYATLGEIYRAGVIVPADFEIAHYYFKLMRDEARTTDMYDLAQSKLALVEAQKTSGPKEVKVPDNLPKIAIQKKRPHVAVQLPEKRPKNS